MQPREFVDKWSRANLNERQGSQSHFLDLCALLDQPPPGDPDSYVFEKAIPRPDSRSVDRADVWKRDCFIWEYKRRGANLNAAYEQAQRYRVALGNPPLLIVSDTAQIKVYTNFTNSPEKSYEFTLNDMLNPQKRELLGKIFTRPDAFRAIRSRDEVTREAAAEFAKLADILRAAGNAPDVVARFLTRILFCLFAEDTNLLPANIFGEMLERRSQDVFRRRLGTLFAAMQNGGDYGNADIKYFNGGLFNDATTLDVGELGLIAIANASRMDWSRIEPAILGTLFERSLDPATRAPLGAHYTSRDDIVLITEPVLMTPLRRRWDALKAQVAAQTTDAATLLGDFAASIARIRVLDPACGSGNFLYVALKQLLDLQLEVIDFARENHLPPITPGVDPRQFLGIEKNAYAHTLAQTTVWIGYIQWLRDKGFGYDKEPILKPLDTIRRMDAILAYDAHGVPTEPAWPAADVVIGNPPFLGGNKIRQELGDTYVDDLFALYKDRVPAFADLVCYWFERARVQVVQGKAGRVGLLATQGIRGGVNRRVLERVKESGDIFMAWADRDWVLDGANVHVSMVGFDNGTEQERTLDGLPATKINANLTGAADIAKAQRLVENRDICFMGPSAKAPFDIDDFVAQRMLSAPININGRPNSDVVRPVASAIDLVQHSRHKWTIDFGLMPLEQATEYEAPFEYIRQNVYPTRSQNRRAAYAQKWWQYAEARPGMREALKGKIRFIATPGVAKYRIFVWVKPEVLCNPGTLVFARDDDYFFGVLHSKVHELWALRMGTQLEDRPRYTPTSTFETFPLPFAPGHERQDDPRVQAIAAAARNLVTKRDAWLNPPARQRRNCGRAPSPTSTTNALHGWTWPTAPSIPPCWTPMAGRTPSPMPTSWSGCWP